MSGVFSSFDCHFFLNGINKSSDRGDYFMIIKNTEVMKLGKYLNKVF